MGDKRELELLSDHIEATVKKIHTKKSFLVIEGAIELALTTASIEEVTDYLQKQIDNLKEFG